MQREFNNDRYNDIQNLVQFEYQSPYQQFNRSTVLGKFSTLFSVKDAEKHCLAL